MPVYRYLVGQRVKATIIDRLSVPPSSRTVWGTIAGRRVSPEAGVVYRVRPDGKKKLLEASEGDIEAIPPRDNRPLRERLLSAGENSEKDPNRA